MMGLFAITWLFSFSGLSVNMLHVRLFTYSILDCGVMISWNAFWPSFSAFSISKSAKLSPSTKFYCSTTYSCSVFPLIVLPSSPILLSLPLAGKVPPRLVFISGLSAKGSRYCWYKFMVDFVISFETFFGFATKFGRCEYSLLPLSSRGIFLFEN